VQGWFCHPWRDSSFAAFPALTLRLRSEAGWCRAGSAIPGGIRLSRLSRNCPFDFAQGRLGRPPTRQVSHYELSLLRSFFLTVAPAPSKPVPSRMMLEGSGVKTAVPVKLKFTFARGLKVSVKP